MKSVLDKRIETMLQGANELQLWVLDAIRQGFGHLQSQPNATWDSIAARMTDSKLAVISRRIRVLRDRRHEAQWPELFFNELADFYLFAQAFRRIESLPEPLQEELLLQGGRTIRRNDLLEQQPAQHDRWLALGQTSGMEEDVRWRRTWFWAERLQKFALVLDFAFRDTPYTQEWLLGSVIDADFHFFPGVYPLRAVVGEFALSNESFLPFDGFLNASSMANAYTKALSENPFLQIFPVVLSGFSIILQQEQFYAFDTERRYLTLSKQEEKNWKLLACSAGHPIELFAEWDGSRLNPLAMIDDQQVIKL